MIDLVVFGDAVLDVCYDLAEPVRPGAKMLGAWAGTEPGGTLANVACVAAGLGLGTRLAGRTTAADAPLHRASLRAGVADGLHEVAAARGSHCVIFRGPDGERTLAFVPIDAPPLPDRIVADAAASARCAYAMAVDLPALERGLGDARLALDLDAAAGLGAGDAAHALARADILFVNDLGFRALTGREPDADGVAALLARGAQNGAGRGAGILCCTGGAGVTWMAERTATGPRVTARAAFPARVVDTTGAGDAFNAAFLATILHGGTADAALDMALATGAIATETRGARTAVPGRDRLLARIRAARGDVTEQGGPT